MSNPLEQPAAPSILREKFPAVRALAALDSVIYRAEKLAVTAALLVMSGTMCLYILYQFASSQRAVLIGVSGGGREITALWPTIVGVIATAAIGRSVVKASPALGSIPWVASIVGLVAAVATVGLAWTTVSIPSWVVCTITTIVICVVFVVPTVLDTPVPISWTEEQVRRSSRVRLAGAAAATVGLVYLASLVPEGYSWAQKLALFLLLWAAFIGASMATHEKRHLSIDAARKIVPESLKPYFNGASSLVAAALSGAFCYLAVLYWQNRLGQETNPGEIPDWVKVLASPTSLALVTLRFGAQGIGSILEGIVSPSNASGSPVATEQE
jgi:C4-dicarboxylate transporter DctQ subunit